MSGARVGVIVPCYNQGRFAAECVASIEAQTYQHLTVVVINDASTDDSAALLDALASSRVRIVHLEKNLGRALVRNEAIRRLPADVDFILNIDCDDRLAADYVEKLVAAMEQHPRAGLAYGTLVMFGELRDANDTSWPREEYRPDERYLENRIPGPGVLFRASALRETAGWREAFTIGNEDFDIWLQVLDRGWQPLWIRDAIYHYRQHASSFLASVDPVRKVEPFLPILALHRRGIDATIGIDAYLEYHVMPQLRGWIRAGEMRPVRRVLGKLLRIAPLATIRALARYYWQRLSAR